MALSRQHHQDGVFQGPHRGLFALNQPTMTEAAFGKRGQVVDRKLYLMTMPPGVSSYCRLPHQYEESKLGHQQYYPNGLAVGGDAVQKPPVIFGWGKVLI